MVKFVSAYVERDKKKFKKMDFCAQLPTFLIEKHRLTQTFYHGLHGLFATEIAEDAESAGFLVSLVFSASTPSGVHRTALKASFRHRDLPSSTRPSKWPFYYAD